MRRSKHPQGTVHRLIVESKALIGNRLGDDTARIVDVYVPHGHDGKDLPLLVDLVGYTAGGPAHTAWKAFSENVPERLDRLIGEGTLAPVVVAFPDCYSRLGGNQYVNSPVVGNYEDFLIAEMLPAVEQKFGCGGTGRRGVFGKSSGGFGAHIHAMRHPDVWSAAASHSGDAGFDLLYLGEFPNTLRALAKTENSIKQWLTAFESKVKIDGKDTLTLMILAQAASFDPDPSEETFLGLRLPVTYDTCDIIEERWANWLQWDPAEMVKTHAQEISKLKAFYFDCGTEDQYNILYGSRRIQKILSERGIEHRYEEFPDNHSGVDYRMDISLPYLVDALNK
ncbi:alpha/beta hydrolase-fold protein [Devosia sp. MC521]|uniref:alpha/beta hydrolase n=1 Tax=Devosia sp. MC521 TaxID=2759954 RepID=UPI0015FC6868|nr:alpha/beta hydrolase-fold protein [Devosia sp. MC521]MBJ6988726.1 enterochelin esterase [Devosia sp. MC521]QMW62218.1 enterochelin esterase [Devosia sp. MC521]